MVLNSSRWADGQSISSKLQHSAHSKLPSFPLMGTLPFDSHICTHVSKYNEEKKLVPEDLYHKFREICSGFLSCCMDQEPSFKH